jgi:tetratricopeptide (TPR) repeat protein
MAQRLMPLLLAALLLLPSAATFRAAPAGTLRDASSGTFWDWHWFEPAARRNQKGMEAYRQGQYAAALEQFLSAKGLRPAAQPLKFNTAAALYQLKKFKEALDEFGSIDESKLGANSAALHYDLGNVHYRLGDYAKALESYKRSLRLDPDDVACKKNFELTLKRLQEQQQQQPQPQPDQQAGQQQQQKYEALMQFLNQNEKRQMEKKKRKVAPARNEKDW